MKSIELIALEYTFNDVHRVQLKHDQIYKYLISNKKHKPVEWYESEALRRTEIFFKAKGMESIIEGSHGCYEGNK